jgi:hypothetical protein
MEPYVRRLTRVLDRRLGWHRSRLNLIARMVRAAIETRTTNLAEWAVPIKPRVQTDSTYRRIQAFFEKFTFEKFTPDYEDLGRFLLDLVPTDPPHAVVVDRTEWHFGSKAVNALVAGVAHGGIAYPVAWTVLDHKGGSGAAEQIEVVGRLTDVLAPGDIRALMAYREFTGADWIEVLADRDIPFVLRLKSDRRVGLPDGPALPVRMFLRPLSKGQSRHLDGPRRIGGTGDASSGDASSGPVRVQVLRKRLDDESLLIVAARGVDESEATDLYRRRWEIETLFAALKSKGFGLEETGPLCSRVSGEEPVPLWIEPVAGNSPQCVADAGSTTPMCADARRSTFLPCLPTRTRLKIIV